MQRHWRKIMKLLSKNRVPVPGVQNNSIYLIVLVIKLTNIWTYVSGWEQYVLCYIYQQHFSSEMPVATPASDTIKLYWKSENYIVTHFGLILWELYQWSLVAWRTESTTEECMSFMKLQQLVIPKQCPWSWSAKVILPSLKLEGQLLLLESKTHTHW